MTKRQIETFRLFKINNTRGFTDEERAFLNEELVFDLITEIREGYINIKNNKKIIQFIYNWADHLWNTSFIAKKKGEGYVKILL